MPSNNTESNSTNIENTPSTYEELYDGCEIYIEPNPDQWTEGYTWTVCRDDCILEEGLEATPDEALKAARDTRIK